MSNGWIPTTERLPDQREFIESYVRSAYAAEFLVTIEGADKADRKSTRLNSSHIEESRMPSSA